MPKNKTCPEKWNRDNKINLLHSDYKILSDGGLTVPSSSLADFTCVCLAVLDFAETEFGKKKWLQEKQQHLSYIGFTKRKHYIWRTFRLGEQTFHQSYSQHDFQ